MFGFPEGKRYNTSAGRYRRIYGERLQKLVIDAGFSCPNRDGTLGTGGCTYCDNAAFHPGYSVPGKTLHQQIDEGIEFHRRRYPKVTHYLAYFQSYTNTHGDTERLIGLYEEALRFPGVKGLVIATRPDSIRPDLRDWFEQRFGRKAPQEHPHLLVEIGIESTIDRTLELINRRHTFRDAQECITDLAERGIDTGAHLILGLPGETHQDFMTHADRVSALPVKTLKLHQLQVVRGTALARMYEQDPGSIRLFETPQEYAAVVRDFMERARKDLFYDRFVSESPRSLLIAPAWNIKPQDFIQKL